MNMTLCCKDSNRVCLWDRNESSYQDNWYEVQSLFHILRLFEHCSFFSYTFENTPDTFMVMYYIVDIDILLIDIARPLSHYYDTCTIQSYAFYLCICIERFLSLWWRTCVAFNIKCEYLYTSTCFCWFQSRCV